MFYFGAPAFKHPSGCVLKRWARNRIWLENSTSTDIVVYVHRFKQIKQVLEQAYKVAAGAPGTVSFEMALKAALEKGLTQEFNISAEETAEVRVNLGSGSGGAYVTTRAQSSYTTLFGKNIVVEPGWCYTIKPPSFEDEALTQPAPVAAGLSKACTIS